MIKYTACIAIVAIAAVSCTGVASAQGGAGTHQQRPVLTLIKQLRQHGAELKQIRKEVLEDNPELRKQRQAFADMVREVVKAQGYNVEVSRARAQKMAKKLKSGQLSRQERKEVLRKLMAERQAWAKARAAAVQEPKVREAGRQLRQNMIAAMKASSDRVAVLLQEMKRLQQRLRALKQSKTVN